MEAVNTIAAGGIDLETSAASQALQYGVVGLIALIFAWVIVRLYRENREDRKSIEVERGKWVEREQVLKNELKLCEEKCAREKEAITVTFERKHREVLEGYTQMLSQVHSDHRNHEDLMRTAHASQVDKMAVAYQESTDAMVEMVQKIYERLVPVPRS